MTQSPAQASTTTPTRDVSGPHGEQTGDRASARPGPGSAGPADQPDLSRILRLSVPVMVVLAEQEMAIKSILEISAGTIVEFSVPFDAELELRVANQTIGRGNAIKIGENFGLRITAIDSVSRRVDAMSGG